MGSVRNSIASKTMSPADSRNAACVVDEIEMRTHGFGGLFFGVNELLGLL
jgi:hypothetical protein